MRRRRLTPSFVRVTLGGAALARFEPQGFDQWVRLFVPVDDGSSLARVPGRLTPRSYLRYLRLSRDERPLMRSYTVSGYRPDAAEAELDLDVVVHDEGARGARWATTCEPGDPVALIDGGRGFVLPDGIRRVELVGDATALPAVAGILARLPADATGRAVVQLRETADRRDLPRPPGLALDWVSDAARTVTARPVDAVGTFGWVAGEATLVAAVRRHWLAGGLPRDRVAFCGYWRRG